MADRSVYLVCGFGRCGTSLVMQMLNVGGIETTGEWPAFETPESNLSCFDGDWIANQRGKAVKVLDPHRPQCHLPATGPYRIVWLDRNHEQQAKSQVKILRLMMGIPVGRNAWRAFAGSFKADRPAALAALKRLGPVMTLHFEEILGNSGSAAALIRNHLGAGDAEKMAGAIRPRTANCLPDLAMELALIGLRTANIDAMETESAGDG